MGVYDSVIVECPNCGYDVEFQSKAGECGLKVYYPSSVPIAIAVDLNGDTERCLYCNKYYTLKSLIYIDRVPMLAIPEEEIV